MTIQYFERIILIFLLELPLLLFKHNVIFVQLTIKKIKTRFYAELNKKNNNGFFNLNKKIQWNVKKR